MDKHEKTVFVGSSVGTLDLLGLIFVVLKLLGKITWSWWLVTLPFWGPIALILVAIIILLIAHWIISLGD